MNHSTSTTPVVDQSCPIQPITVELPLATIEELDYLAGLHHIAREDEITELIVAALITPADVLGDDKPQLFAEHRRLTRDRSFQLAAERVG